ncbi:MAG: hypothetical protein ACYS18_03965 [Planctomycetota bacterium]|jgi:tetratricopeptide (TPR) repeat protein
MLRFLGKILAVPVRMLANLASLTSFIDAESLWAFAWRLSRKPQDGANWLFLNYRKYGLEAARELAKKIMLRSKSCAFAAAIAFIEYHNKNPRAACLWANTAKKAGYEEPEALLMLELFLSDILDEYDRTQVVEQILSRNDLPGQVTLSALIVKANSLLDLQKWQQAEKIADRILSIQEQNDARFIKWVVSLQRDQKAQADEHLQKAKGKLPKAVFYLAIAHGLLCLGRKKEAMEALRKAGKIESYLKHSKSKLGQLVRSKEFKNFFMAEEN